MAEEHVSRTAKVADGTPAWLGGLSRKLVQTSRGTGKAAGATKSVNGGSGLRPGWRKTWERPVWLPAWYSPAVLVPYVVTRALLLAAALVAPRILPFNRLYPGYPLTQPTPFDWLNSLSRWDGAWYVGIARDGYSYHAGQQSNIAFSPLLPLLIRVFAWPAADNDTVLYLAGVLVSNVALLVALGFLVGLLRELIDARTAERTALYLLLFPTTLFLSALYPHSLFLALVLAAVYCARRQYWWIAGALGAAAALTRPYGALVVVPLAWEYVSQVYSGRPRVGPALASLAFAPLAFVGWTLYLWSLTGGPTGLAESSAVWNRYLIAPWWAAGRLLALATLDRSVAGPDPVVDGGLTILFVPLVIAAWWRRIPALAAFGTALFAVLISTSQMLSVSRYLLEVLPAFVVLAVLGNFRPLHWLYVVCSGTAALALMIAYSLGYVVA